jgi:hypothetical protein
MFGPLASEMLRKMSCKAKKVINGPIVRDRKAICEPRKSQEGKDRVERQKTNHSWLQKKREMWCFVKAFFTKQVFQQKKCQRVLVLHGGKLKEKMGGQWLFLTNPRLGRAATFPIAIEPEGG